MKQSSQKATYPGRKQIFRAQENAQILTDRLALAEETASSNEQPLLELVMEAGQPVKTPETLEIIRQRTQASVASLPVRTRQLDDPISVPVNISNALESLRQSCIAQIKMR
jgi:nicotinate phosphoribosyltransferase